MALQFLAVIVALTAIATITLWREAARRPSKPNKKFLASLFDAKPITPAHNPPASIAEGFDSLVRDADQLFFDDFLEFGDVVNWWFSDRPDESPWRLQELADTDLSLEFSDMPDFGRRYEIFHNQVPLGTIEISPGFQYSTENPVVRTNVQLDFIRLLTFDTVRDFLTEIAMHVSDNANEAEKLQVTQAIDRSLIRVVWQSQEISKWARWGLDEDDWGELNLRLDGSATWYLVRRQALSQKVVGQVEADDLQRFFTSRPIP